MSILYAGRMNKTTKKILIVVGLLAAGIAIGVGAVYAMERMQDFDRLMDAREAAPDKEEFDRNFEAMAEWFEDYKRDNPGATDEDAERAYMDIWKG